MNKNSPFNLANLGKQKEVKDYQEKIERISKDVIKTIQLEELSVYDMRMVITVVSKIIDDEVNKQILPKLTK